MRVPSQIAEDFNPDRERRLYPTEMLESAESALLLFAAGFLGRNDGYWFLEAGVPRVTCVDVVPERLAAMRALYPDSWDFVDADAFDFAWSLAPQSYDIVSVDSHTALSETCLHAAPLWMKLARKCVILGVQWQTLGVVDERLGIEEVAAIIGVEEFAVVELRERNDRSIWIVLERWEDA